MAFSFGACSNGLKYSFVPEALPFSEASAECIARGGSLAVPHSSVRHQDIVNFYLGQGASSVWIGLNDLGNGLSGPQRFDLVSGELNPFTFSRGTGQFPWAGGQPDDANQIEDCVEYAAGVNLLNDLPCDTERQAVCEHFCGTPPTFLFNSCINGKQIFFNPDNRFYEEAQILCQQLDPQAHLLVPDSQNTLTTAGQFVLSQLGPGQFSHIGSRDFTEDPNAQSLGRFTDFDGSEFDAFDLWAGGNPSFPAGNEFCVMMDYAGAPKLHDRPCLEERQAICERPCGNTVDPNFVSDVCRENLQLLFNPIAQTHDAAQLSCENIGGNLATPISIERHNNMNFAISAGGQNTWFGLRDFADVGGNANAARFLGNNGLLNPFTQVPLVFPWGGVEPNDAGANENCVELLTNNLYNDLDCANARVSVCEKYCGQQPAFIFGECRDDVQYFFSNEPRTWNAALADCQQVNPIATLAVPRNAERLNRIIDLFQSNRPEARDAYIGLRDYADVGGDGNTARFLTPEGVALAFTSGPKAQFPWAAGEPNDDVNFNGLQNCATIFAERDRLMDDFICTGELFSVCEQPCTTPFPTSSPTQNPTANPTGNPTQNPTANPTSNPTQNPTGSPTQNPTLNPTGSPSENPTLNPTISPTISPTVNPTVSPTLNPTVNPTVSPTVNPTVSPTLNPTLNPTVSPTLNPTLNPTVSPTLNPTVSPTLNPTLNPTTLSPTDSPTSNPTISPTTEAENEALDDDEAEAFIIVIVVFLVICLCCVCIFLLAGRNRREEEEQEAEEEDDKKFVKVIDADKLNV